MKILGNPIAFRPLPVTIISSIVYAALIISLLVVHHIVPEPPKTFSAVNLTEAWLDLQVLTGGFHPYNSRRNDEVRSWLLERIETIRTENTNPSTSGEASKTSLDNGGDDETINDSPIVVFSDTVSNLSFSFGGSSDRKTSVYFEGTNIIVYVRGSEDETFDWSSAGSKAGSKAGGVLVNAHYDSVSTGYGATDDGVGVVTILQLIKYFSSPGRQPKKGIIALLNNGEEDSLNGARAFSQHPTSRFPHTFLNLEGAGAGGRAVLFRSTDTEVTRFYQKSRLPFGSVLAADGFKKGFIKSDTDYTIFNGVLGMRGLDVSFMEPRARYHTEEDDMRHTSQASLYHMLSTALTVVEGLSSDTGSEFDGQAKDGQVSSGKGSNGVWFDLFGSAFAVFQLHTLFALSVTLLVVAPLTLIAIGFGLYKADKLYLFSSSKRTGHAEADAVGLQGLRGILRWPIAFVLASAAVLGLAFLVSDLNPYISYSSPYAVWSLMISAWLVVAWTCLSTANYFRPTALQRLYTMLWIFLTGWVLLILATVLEQKQNIASGYLMFFYFACIYLATTVSFVEIFGLPRKSDYAAEIQGRESGPTRPGSGYTTDAPLLAAPAEEQEGRDVEEDDQANESTSLLHGTHGRTTFKRTSPHRGAASNESRDEPLRRKVYDSEQPWSHCLPSSLWLLEFLLFAPIPLILLGQIALLVTSGVHQTPADGNPALQFYLFTAILSILLFLPLTPHLHRLTYHIPLFLFLVFLATLLYNLLAFPFSPNNRLKLFFQQSINLDTGTNTVSLTGIPGPYLLNTIASLPSAAGQIPDCNPSPIRKLLTTCTWTGLPPNVVPFNNLSPDQNRPSFESWLSYNITHLTRSTNTTRARFRIHALNTRACKIRFDTPIADFHVLGSGPHDPRFVKVPQKGSGELRLWSRERGRGWEVDVVWEEEGKGKVAREGERKDRAGLGGEVVCMWADPYEKGVIPAFDEVKMFAPAWVVVTKAGDGLVEGWKGFVV